ncbi:cyclic-di-AMP-binding protein CbpB [Alkalicoccus urumqiensis]|uniref:CBS domain-containing protein n=1 Tax=Alkalicoccus urumqiensis TaxID=1548213 RepID=A0A2P6MKC7_ALKUR|nr:cyclic-di-AMP-binding protein CbpB [Alkalicoccus urumqiensis]PRO66744.1 CBS domain-containing protein [Alkalicoccus urumqiensis]
MPNIQETDLLAGGIDTFIIPADQVAHVQPDNSLEHALLVLVKSGYTAIPVLGMDSCLRGIISKAKILDSILGVERMEPEKLSSLTVEEVMERDFSAVKADVVFEKVMSLSIQYPFVCVENHDGQFKGIIPRSKILAHLNGYLHELRKTNPSM